MTDLINPLAGHRYYWLRQYGDTAEQTTAAILGTLNRYGGGDGLALKCADGQTWQGNIDPLTPVRSAVDVAVLRAACNAAGVALLPVVNARGANPVTEAQFHATIANAAGCLMVDIEEGAGYWDGSPLSQIPLYCQTLRSAAGDAVLILEPSPLPSPWTSLNVPALVPFFDALSPQQYVGWTAAGWTDVAAEVARFQAIAALGLPLLPTLWGEDQTDLAVQFWQAIQSQAAGMCLFAFGQMDATQLQTFAALSVTGDVPPAPPADNPVTRAEFDALAARVDRLNGAETWRNRLLSRDLVADVPDPIPAGGT